MLRYMLDTNICIYVIKNRPAPLRERFNNLADQLCMSTICARIHRSPDRVQRPAPITGKSNLSQAARISRLLAWQRAVPSHTRKAVTPLTASARRNVSHFAR
jgi:predicted nucleic acid-binding protein